MDKNKLTAEVYERKGLPGVWGVEAIDMAGDGECHLTLFSGPEAEGRAREYAAAKYT